MSVHVMSWVFRHSEERLGNRLVLLVLADYASDEGASAFPKIDTIAAEARLSRSQAIRCLKSLVENGAIEEIGKRPSGTKEYRVLMEEGSHIATPGVASTSDGASQGSHPGTPGVAGRDPIHHEPPVTTEPPLSLAPAARAYDPLKGRQIDGRNLPWDALAQETGADERVEAGQLAAALKKIRSYVAPELSPQVIAEPAACERHIANQIRGRARLYRTRWPTVECTPTALAKHWSRVVSEAPGVSPESALEAAQRGIDEAQMIGTKRVPTHPTREQYEAAQLWLARRDAGWGTTTEDAWNQAIVDNFEATRRTA